MHRLFVAVKPPEAVLDRVADLMEGLPGARWSAVDQLHVTARFIGEVDGRTAEDAAQLLAGLRHAPFEIALTGLGVFDRRGRAETLWMGVAPHAPLKSLHEKIDRALLPAGITPETRTYHPHLTIARLQGDCTALGGYLAKYGDVTSERFTVQEAILYESRLGSASAHHEAVLSFALRQ